MPRFNPLIARIGTPNHVRKRLRHFRARQDEKKSRTGKVRDVKPIVEMGQGGSNIVSEELR
jgi:hypothetical protein